MSFKTIQPYRVQQNCLDRMSLGHRMTRQAFQMALPTLKAFLEQGLWGCAIQQQNRSAASPRATCWQFRLTGHAKNIPLYSISEG